MPCYDPRPSDVANETKRRLDIATRVACSVLRTLSKEHLKFLPKETQAWWEEHQEMDRLRAIREN